MDGTCAHLKRLGEPAREPVSPSGPGCSECLQSGGDWVQLRLCLSCGHVGCCDSSPGQHATEHFHRTRHPTMKAFEPGQDWAWCYVDEILAKGLPILPGESAERHYSAPRTSHP